MIAISANTHKVTVIAYALTQPTEAPRCLSSSSNSELEECSDEEDLSDFPSPRRQDHTIILPAHHNVPSVSFDNSGDDPSGRWLSSCSINGETLIWDLHNPGKPVRTIRLGYCASVKDPTKAPKLNPGTCACLRPSNFPHAIWSTMFLDANTAYEDVSLQHLVPPLADHPLPHIRDIGKDRFPFTVMPRKPLAMIVPLNEPLAEEASSEMDVSETDSVASDFSEAMSISSLATTSIADTQHSEDAEVMTSPLHGSSSASQLSVVPFESTEYTAEAIAPSQIIPGSLNQAPPHTLGNAVNAFGPWFQPPDQEATTIAKMISPLLIVTKEDVHLYQRPLDYVGDHSDHIITLRHPLHPEDCQKPFPSIPGSHDRHCYTTQIPELGVFIIASPNGRAGVFSLNRAPDHSPGRPQFGFQLENILPFANSDDSKIWDVEGARLIGVAAGPVQGMLDKEETSGEQEDRSNPFEKNPGSRRWRVMMYYTDHTVLAFELGKRREGEVPEVDQLVV
ncbi:hypothetical protein E8E13_008058 [Curvularia kusanoi]|uniref:Uncharacterized protein n=1 Tax=Curvularia kusanoi TaxID=90978 RepID=A0A9P4W730_CURKU|nr:hypothetical protein E8E13_008058 [Curvularia kusanoi]